MIQAILIIHVLVAASIIGLVLLQQGKGADAGAAFGGSSGSQTFFGARGSANFLTRLTGVLAAVFFLTSIGLAFLYARVEGPRSVTEQIAPVSAPAGTDVPAPAAPEAPDVPAAPAEPAVPDVPE